MVLLITVFNSRDYICTPVVMISWKIGLGPINLTLGRGVVGAKAGAYVGGAIGSSFWGAGALPGAIIGGIVGGVAGSIGGTQGFDYIFWYNESLT